MEQVVGFWLRDRMYRMHNPRTGRTRFIAMLTDDPSEQAEWVQEAHEDFVADLKGGASKTMATRDDQHELGSVLQDVRASNRRRIETGHGRWW